ncbi:MAG: hypothetical protein CL608_25780 [Anaerolineaceae bacterium]|nr:hypothetical protein [Anaerolineaceae bacterium]
MANGRLFHLLAAFWLGMAAICLLGHYVADAAALGQANTTSICQAEENVTSGAPGESSPNMVTLHTGFSLPPVLSVAAGPALSLATIVLILPPITLKPPVLSPPPR